MRRPMSRWITAASLALASLATVTAASAQETQAAATVPGLVATPVEGSVHQVAGRFADNVRTSGMTIFARIDHRQGAMSRDMAMLPNEVIVFGNPKTSTPLMQCAATAGIDLPMKALIWQDSDGQTWLGYDDPQWIATRHGVGDCPAVAPLSREMQALVEATKS